MITTSTIRIRAGIDITIDRIRDLTGVLVEVVVTRAAVVQVQVIRMMVAVPVIPMTVADPVIPMTVEVMPAAVVPVRVVLPMAVALAGLAVPMTVVVVRRGRRRGSLITRRGVV